MNKDLNAFSFTLNRRNSLYIPLLSSAIEHCISIYFLNKEQLTASMYALVRPALENYLRAMWVKNCVSDKELEKELSSMHFPKKIEYLIQEVDKKIPEFDECSFLQMRLEHLIKNLHDYTHGGVESIARQYQNGKTLTNLRDENEINSILNLMILISSLSYVELITDNVKSVSDNSENIKKIAQKLLREL